MPNVHLTQSRVNALRPRKRPFELRDSTLRGFGVRVMPSGAKCYFIHSQHDGRRIWRVVGLAPAMDLDEARVHARAMLGALRCGKVAPTRPANTAFESVAEEVFRRYTRHWKSATLTVNRQYLRKQILPYFKGRPISEITVEEVRHWFDALHLTPMAANRSLPILSVIMREAEVYGYRPEESNPCRGIQRYRSRGRERFLCREEFARIGAVLRRLEGTRPLQVGAIALLLHTGCRRSEITTLQWHHVREGKLFATDRMAVSCCLRNLAPFATQETLDLPLRTQARDTHQCTDQHRRRTPHQASSQDHERFRDRQGVNDQLTTFGQCPRHPWPRSTPCRRQLNRDTSFSS